MKCVIWCGGRGLRMGAETESKPKALVMIHGKTILEWIMTCYSRAGVTEFILLTGYKNELIDEYVKQLAWDITCLYTGENTKTAKRLIMAKHLLEKETFCLTYCDGLTDMDISKLLAFAEYHKKPLTVTGIRMRTQYGTFSLKGRNIAYKFEEKPFLDQLVNGGFMVCTPAIWQWMIDVDEMFEKLILPMLAKAEEVVVYPFTGYWHSMDTQQDKQEIEGEWRAYYG